MECPRDSFTATLRLQTSDGVVTRAWVTTVRAGERSPASSYDFWRRVGEEATEAADECVKKAGGSTLGTVARLLVAVAHARDASALTAAARHKASVERSAPRVGGHSALCSACLRLAPAWCRVCLTCLVLCTAA